MRPRNTCAGTFRKRIRAIRMIGKVIRGTNVGRLLCYLYGPGKANEHTDPHLVAGFSDPADLERRFGLRSTAPADRTATRRTTQAETEHAMRRGWAEPPRATLRREVSTAAAGSGTEQEFFARLDQAGILVRKRYSTAHPGEVTG